MNIRGKITFLNQAKSKFWPSGHLKIKAVPSFETLAEIKELTERNMPEDLNIDRLSIFIHKWEMSPYFIIQNDVMLQTVVVKCTSNADFVQNLTLIRLIVHSKG